MDHPNDPTLSPPPPPPPPESSGDRVVQAIFPYRNSLALIGYYLGVFSLIPCLALGLGPAAFILGILAWRHSNQHPEAHGKGHALTAMILGGLTFLLNGSVLAYIILNARFTPSGG